MLPDQREEPTGPHLPCTTGGAAGGAIAAGYDSAMRKEMNPGTQPQRYRLEPSTPKRGQWAEA